MELKTDKLITISPQIHCPSSTFSIMWAVVLCLVPAGLWGIFVFGLRALGVIIVSLLAALAGEALGCFWMKRGSLQDGSAFLTGLLVAYNMPVGVPLYVPAVASLFAILVVKWSFGGLGANWMNPALAGRVFVFFSWTGSMTRWNLPATWRAAVDGTTGASPLGHIKAGILEFTGTASGPLDFLAQTNYPVSPMGRSVSAWFETTFGISTNPASWDLFLGNVPGCIGEVSALLLILGALYLFAKKIITWEVPLGYIAVFSLLVWVFGGRRLDGGYFSGEVLFHLFSGGLILAALYMATDMVTSPLTRRGMLLYGGGCGFLTFLIRFYGSFPEGVSLAIIIMNLFVPLINRFTNPKRFGLAGKEKG